MIRIKTDLGKRHASQVRKTTRVYVTQVLTREIKYNPPHAKITIGVQTAGPGGSNACSPSCSKPPVTSQKARLTTTAEQSAITVLLRPKEIASGIPIRAITITLNGVAYFG